MARILVAYATRNGSTALIAEAIARELEAAGHRAEAVEIGRVPSPAGYDGVVLGGPVYIGRIDGRLGKYVRRHTGVLARLPVAGFVVCLAAASEDAAGIAIAEKALHAALLPLSPVAETVFAGSLDPDRLSWLQRWMITRVKSPVGDFRNWDTIRAWARELPGKMKV